MRTILRSVISLALLSVACGEQPAQPALGGPATLTIHLTDATGDISAAVITIAQVYLQGTGGRTVLRNAPYTVDLVSLAQTSTVLLEDVPVVAGAYPELRFVVTGAYVAVEDGNGSTRIFATTPDYAGLPSNAVVDGELQLPSFATSGFKVQLPDGGLRVPTSGVMSLLVDFDVARSFGQQAGASGMWVMHPVITATDVTQGTMLTATLALGTGVTLPTGVTLGDFHATLSGASAPGTVLATASFNPDGSGVFRAALGFVAPGPYLVNIVPPSGLSGVTVSPPVPFTFTAQVGPSTTLAFVVSSAATTKPVYVTNASSFSITAYAAGANGNVTPRTTIAGSNTGLLVPAGIARDAGGNIYVVNAGGDRVTVYAGSVSGNATPTATIAGSNTGLSKPSGLALDRTGNVYVSNINGRITVYAAGASGNATPFATIEGSNTGLSNPQGIALDGAGNIYVANSVGGSITVYASGGNGNTTPIATIAGGNTGLNGPLGIALDVAGNLYVANNNAGTVTVYAAGASGNAIPTTTIAGSNTGLSHPLGIAVDAAGLIYVVNGDLNGSSIRIYAAGASGNATPIATIAGNNTGLDGPGFIAF